MPAGTDLITWNPRVGATGDDRYNIDLNTAIGAGSSSYSSPPTISEINAGSGINQIIAEVNRRCGESDDALVQNGSISTVAYIAAGGAISLLALTAKIDLIRENEDQAYFSTATGQTGQAIRGAWVAAMREALSLDYISVYLDKSDHNFETYSSPVRRQMDCYLKREDSFYPPTTTSVFPDINFRCGQRGSAGPTYGKYRPYFFFRIPAIPSLGDALLSIHSDGDFSSQDFNMNLYRANSHLAPLGTGDWGNLDNLEDSIASSSWPSDSRLTLDVDHTAINGSSGLTYILASDREVADTTPFTNEYVEIDGMDNSLVEFDILYYPILKLYTA